MSDMGRVAVVVRRPREWPLFKLRRAEAVGRESTQSRPLRLGTLFELCRGCRPLLTKVQWRRQPDRDGDETNTAPSGR
jgi:hypothetical protein